MQTEMTTGKKAAISKPAPAERRATSSVNVRVDWVWTVCALAAAGLLAAAAFMPLWTMRLLAPQYPNGLELTAYGTRMEGDLSEINALNHYVGVRALKPDSIVELQLFPYAIGVVVALVAVSAFVPRFRKIPLRPISIALVWLVPIGFLVDLQFWLYSYGHDLDPTAPFRIPEFTPKVIGKTQVINFYSDNMVTTGFWFFVAAAVVISILPLVIRFIRDAWQNTGEAAAAVAGVGIISLAAVLALTQAGTAPAAVAQGAQAPGRIQAAIDAAQPGDTVTIPAGVYRETVVVNKTLTLQGEGEPVIDGEGRGDVVVVEADGVTIRGFVITGSSRRVSEEPAGIRLTGDNATVENNRLHEVLYGIILIGSDGHTIRNNDVSSIAENPTERRGHAIYLWYTSHNVIENNILTKAKDGIFLGFATFNQVHNNNATDVRYGIHYMYSDDNVFTKNVFEHNVAGAAIMYSRRIELTENVFANNRSVASGYGILLKDVDDVTIQGNLIHNNRLGLTMEGAPQSPQAFVRLEKNLIGYNQTAIELTSTTNATFVGNSFMGNLREVEERGGAVGAHNRWSEDGRGNYWDSYQGYDAQGDGVGDLPYRYEGIYDDLVEREEALKAYRFSFAQTALDTTARWFPVYRPNPRVVDQQPLMSPTIKLPAEQGRTGTAATFAAISALVIVPVVVFSLSRRTFRRRWEPC